MNKKYSAWQRTSASLFLYIFSAFILTSCGGGGGENTTTTSTSGSTNTPSTSTPRPPTPTTPPTTTPTTQVINGFTVPLPPNLTINNATLVGIDSNNNGVRDDVEISIAKTSETKKTFDDAIEIAKIINKIVIGNYSTALSLSKDIDCASMKNETIDIKEIFNLYSNIPERKLQIVKWHYSKTTFREMTQNDPEWGGILLCK